MRDVDESDREYNDEELLSFEISEDARLRSTGIDPNGDPIEIMAQIMRLAAEKRKRDEADDEDDANGL